MDAQYFSTIFHVFFTNVAFYSQQYLDRYAFLLPIGIIGIWRWSVWLMKEIIGLHYRVQTKKYNTTVSVVIPVYNENPDIFTRALASWKANNPTEIIAVIDYTDTTCIEIFKKFKKSFPHAILIVTKIPGKRPALADGIAAAKGEIVALVDSDTLWDTDTLEHGLPPFNNPRVAGVATYQNVYHAKSFAQKIFDIQLELRYKHEYPFLAAAGDALVCLSGRTALYRRDVITPMLPQLVNETFMGKPVISGDDKRLTYLVLEAGWKVAYQRNSHVATPGMEDFSSYIKQRLRWTRNSLRADIKALLSGWPFRRPALLFFQIDKFLQTFVVIISPIYFLVSLYLHVWIAAAIIFCWWFVSRSIKIYPYLILHPKEIKIVPVYVFFTFFAGVLKIYALFTLNTQGWITRWHASRMKQLGFVDKLFPVVATACVIGLLTFGVYSLKQYTYIFPHEAKQEVINSALQQGKDLQVATTSAMVQKDLLVKKYIVQSGETFDQIAAKFHIDSNQLWYANESIAPNKKVEPGIVLSIPGKDMQLKPDIFLTKPKDDYTPLAIVYNQTTNTIVVEGRGRQITLKDIQSSLGNKYLKEVSPKLWYLTASIFLTKGTTLILTKNEVTWLQMESNAKEFVTLRALDANIVIDGVKITSWDAQKNTYDTDQSHGRSFIMVKDNSRMDIYNSDFGYLGYETSPDLAVSPYGVAWKLSKEKLKNTMLTGEVLNSKFHDNFFGAYTWGATGMTWEHNEFYHNTRYGLDPHDDSDGFLVEYNYSHNNGTHGIVFSKRCMYNIVRYNVTKNNGLQGIMLHETSNNNIVENNTISDNYVGIALWNSSNNLIQNNTLQGNRDGIRLNLDSDNNTIQHNTIIKSQLYGLYLYDNADANSIKNNIINNNSVGVYVKSDANLIQNNQLNSNAVGIYFQDSAKNNLASGNAIKDSKIYGIYTKVLTNISNILGTNQLFQNRKDVTGQAEKAKKVK